MPDVGRCVPGCSKQEINRFMEWLATELAPTILGSKPATVLSFRDSAYQATLAIWRQHGCEVLKNTLVQFLPLRYGPNLEIVLFYRIDVLEKCITDDLHICFLRELGYPVDEGVDKCLALLHERFSHSCPHEVGVLLGIPLKDVLGFMDRTDLQLTCRKEWCVYGNPDASLAVMGNFAGDKSFVSCLIARGANPYEILSGRSALLGNIA
ncbi:hypothetical protein AXX12_00095 [Anaerosporomusa subterranea]|uniref:DUF3793 domain-containing protein n=1 Tax=Anaerosporomusa subterranea TaxID=1794912 RepID=A0A154BVD3_ANASB|nr:DUF3793 family protein [Anaerosporomusa subterranea]KYZ77983.1 hypothetical protein AXX12_00095 [Anaerosporomusa subterranea]